jgi:WXXGXW repeat (2 copies)
VSARENEAHEQRHHPEPGRVLGERRRRRSLARSIERARGPSYVWVPGSYTWQPPNRTYVWVPGHWTIPPQGLVWVPGHWETQANGTVWVDGQWRHN